jgi:hypothetical protein
VSKLKVGDHVRVSVVDFMPHYQPGDKGIVTSGPHNGSTGSKYFKVSMEKDKDKNKDMGFNGDGIIFCVSEIEPEV